MPFMWKREGESSSSFLQLWVYKAKSPHFNWCLQLCIIKNMVHSKINNPTRGYQIGPWGNIEIIWKFSIQSSCSGFHWAVLRSLTLHICRLNETEDWSSSAWYVLQYQQAFRINIPGCSTMLILTINPIKTRLRSMNFKCEKQNTWGTKY